jgi:hypothetical protein
MIENLKKFLILNDYYYESVNEWFYKRLNEEIDGIKDNVNISIYSGDEGYVISIYAYRGKFFKHFIINANMTEKDYIEMLNIIKSFEKWVKSQEPKLEDNINRGGLNEK